jgi:hypothetical protein
VAFWWNATPHLTAGIQYRYADDKLGEALYQDGLITRLNLIFDVSPARNSSITR